MNITKEWLKEKSTCSDGYEWSLKYLKDKGANGSPASAFIHALMDDNKFLWANWVIVRLFDKELRVKYAIFAAEQVIDIFEKKYPKDQRPRKAIEAAKEYLKNPCDETKKAAAAAYAYADAYNYAYTATAAAAYAYAYAAAAAAAAAYAAAYAAAAAAAAAYAATAADADADAAAAAYAATAADADADAAAAAAKKVMFTKIIEYGLTLLK